MAIGEIGQRRLRTFKANRRGYWSLWIFSALFLVTLFAEVVSNDKPLLVRYDGEFYFPILHAYPETVFDGFFETEADYSDAEVRELIEAKGWILWPLIPFSFDTVCYDLPTPAPSPPTARHWLGTDDQARDVVARLIYGFRISVLFGLALTVFSSVIGIAAGAVQGYFGGRIDLIFQRFIEIWSSLPTLYLLIILASVVDAGILVVARSSLALHLDTARARGARRVPAHAKFRLRASCPFPGSWRCRHHGESHPPQCNGGNTYVSALHPERGHHVIDGARLSRFWVTAWERLARRVAQSRKEQPERSLARPFGIFRVGD